MNVKHKPPAEPRAKQSKLFACDDTSVDIQQTASHIYTR